MKKLFTLLTLMFGLTASAQTITDMTNRLADPDMEQEGRSPWKTNGIGRQTNNEFTIKNNKAFRETWSGGGTVGDYYLYQDICDLPVGTYTLTITAQAIKQSDKNLQCTGAWFYINDERAEFNTPRTDYSLTTVVLDGNIRVGVETRSCNANWVCVDNFRLTYQFIYEDVKDYVQSCIDEVKKVDNGNDCAERTAMLAARDALNTYIAAGQNDKIAEAVKHLNATITAYRYSQATPANPMDVTALITNPSFESGDASWQMDGMGTQGNSDFQKVGSTYAEKWTDRGGHVSNSSLRQTISGLPNGRYRLTAKAQNIQQGSPSTKQTGSYLFGNNSRTGVNVTGVYSVEFVNVNGEVTIGFINENSTGNYTCVDDFHLYFLGSDAQAETEAFNALISDCEKLLGKEMNTTDREALTKAVEAAKKADAENRSTAYNAMLEAQTQAQKSIGLYEELNAIIAKAEKALAGGKTEGLEKLQTALATAKDMKDSGLIDRDMVKTADNMVEDGIFAMNVLNGTGTAPKVTTHPTVIVGGNAMVGRLTATGSNITERGFCWAEHPNPTVLDYHSSYNQNNDETNWSPVYVMRDVKASTEYWVRAYAITKTYAVGYGEPVRVITLPQGETVYTYLWNAGDEHDEWLDNAMREATAYYNTWTAIKGFRPTANYSPGTETADCSYGGWINVGPWRCNTGTMVHEMMHGTGVGQHGRWWSQELHPGGDYGPWWKGERGNRVTQFFENYDSSRGNYVCNGDNIHVCYEGNGNDMQQIRSAILAQALYEDGLPAVSDGACPFYSFESIDSLHYYITNAAYGCNAKYLCEGPTGKLMYKAPASATEMLADSTYAWNVLYDKMTGLYCIRNLKSGKYFNHTGSAVNLTAAQPVSANSIQLMPARINVKYNIGGKVVSKKPYWMARGNRVEYPNVIAIDGANASGVKTPTLDFTDNATKQFWMIYTPEEVQEFEAGELALAQDRLERLIAGSKAVAASKHEETMAGQDDAFLAVVENIEQGKADFTPAETEEAVSQLFSNLVGYLPNIAVADSIDLSFVLDDAALNSGNNWDGLPEVKDGMLNLVSAPTFAATQKVPVKMPKGQYGLLVRGFQRPGDLATVMKDYTSGKNNVSASITFNTLNRKLKHIGDGGTEEKLDQGGTERKQSGLYVPYNQAAYNAYFDAGRYDNLIRTKWTTGKEVTVGVKNGTAKSGDLILIQGFQIFYYGNADMQTDIETLENDEAGEVEGYYNLQGMRIAAPTNGVSIVKFKDGRTTKIHK